LLDHLSGDGFDWGPTGNRPFRTTFFAGARLGLALAAVRFAALRALPRAIAAFLLGAFDCFLRLAMISPRSDSCFATH
jgi:hypothetical protein